MMAGSGPVFDLIKFKFELKITLIQKDELKEQGFLTSWHAY